MLLSSKHAGPLLISRGPGLGFRAKTLHPEERESRLKIVRYGRASSRTPPSSRSFWCADDVRRLPRGSWRMTITINIHTADLSLTSQLCLYLGLDVDCDSH